MMPNSTRLPYEQVKYLINVLNHDDCISTSIYSCPPPPERQAEIQVLGFFDMMKAPEEGLWSYSDGGYIS